MTISSRKRRQPIAFLDSGVGGLPYLELARRLLPDEEFVYIGDTANFPYGPKSPETLQDLLGRLVRRLIGKADPKAVVIACNTASVAALHTLRKEFDLPFVGIVPAIKPAASISENGRIGLLATDRTTRDIYTRKLIEDFAPEAQVVLHAAGDLVEFVEQRYIGSTEAERQQIVHSYCRSFVQNSVDVVILGCSHFIHLSQALEKGLPEHVRVIDSREGVINQLIRVLDQNHLRSGIASDSSVKNGCRLFVSADNGYAEAYRQFAPRYRLQFCGTL